MAKRRHDDHIAQNEGQLEEPPVKISRVNGSADVKSSTTVIQIVAGSYERVLHGISASLLDSTEPQTVEFADTFLFNAHASAIRCLALSPPPNPDALDTQGYYLATGGTDERINVYNLAASPTSDNLPPMPSLSSNKTLEDPRNREIGGLMHHSSSVTALHFPTRSKLLSASEDNTIAISRTRDLTVVSSIKAPRPKAIGQPSGDTAPLGTSPAGVNDFAVHPSMKLMLSVGRGERCMRLWNLVTGKKAGVLNFDRELLQRVSESKYSSGEGRRVHWSPNGTEFTVAFERGAIGFGADSKPKRLMLPQPLTKLHQIIYTSVPSYGGDAATMLLVSTEDGRVLFYPGTAKVSQDGAKISPEEEQPFATLGGREVDMTSRIKDFDVIHLQSLADQSASMLIITAGSDGMVRIWKIDTSQLSSPFSGEDATPQRVGDLIGTHKTGNRITCLKAFLMMATKGDVLLSEFEGLTDDEVAESDSDEE